MVGEQLLLPSQETLLQRIEHLACYGEQLVVLHGAQGSGRSTMLTALANELDDHNLAWVVCPQHASAAEIRRKIIVQLLPDPLFDDEKPLADTLLRCLPKLQKPVHILLDDADNLPLSLWAECLLLTQLQFGGAPLTLTLSVKPGFIDPLLQQLKPKQRQLLLPIGLEPLSMAEREGLYQTLLARAARRTFTPRSIVVRQLEQQTGTPLEVLDLLAKALEEPVVDAAGRPWPRYLALTFIGLLLLAGGGWYGLKFQQPLPQLAPQPPVLGAVTTLAPALFQHWLPPAFRSSATPVAIASTGSWPWIAEARTVNEVDSDSELLQDAAAAAGVATADIAAATPEVSTPKASDKQAPSMASTKTKPATATQATPVTGGAVVTPKNTEATQVTKGNAAMTTLANTPAAATLVLPRQGFTLQVASVKQQQSVAGQLQQLPKDLPVWLCRRGQWWVIFVGEFAQRSDAQKVAARLQQAGLEQPWLRPWSELRDYQPQPLP